MTTKDKSVPPGPAVWIEPPLAKNRPVPMVPPSEIIVKWRDFSLRCSSPEAAGAEFFAVFCIKKLLFILEGVGNKKAAKTQFDGSSILPASCLP